MARLRSGIPATGVYAGLARTDALDGRVRDPPGGVEVGLAGAEVDDVAAFGPEALGQRAYGDGGRGLESGDVRAVFHPGNIEGGHPSIK